MIYVGIYIKLRLLCGKISLDFPGYGDFPVKICWKFPGNGNSGTPFRACMAMR